jgi:hypothetical protein
VAATLNGLCSPFDQPWAIESPAQCGTLSGGQNRHTRGGGKADETRGLELVPRPTSTLGAERGDALARSSTDVEQWLPPPHPSSRSALRAVASRQIARYAGSGGGALCGASNVAAEPKQRAAQVSSQRRFDIYLMGRPPVPPLAPPEPAAAGSSLCISSITNWDVPI